MADDPQGTPPQGTAPPSGAPGDDTGAQDSPGEGEGRADRGISDFVRRAVSAGFEAATRSKEEVVRVAASEVRGWLDRLDLDSEIVKALSRMVIEVKTEVRFRPNEEGRLIPETSQETRIKNPPPKG